MINEFNEILRETLEKRQNYLNESVFPKMRELFQVYKASFDTLYSILLERGFIKDDPYKHEYKISEISIPSTAPMSESTMEVEIGIRFSMYKTQVVHIENYYTFNLNFITLNRIILIEKLLNYINWDSMTETSTNQVTKAVAMILVKVYKNIDQMPLWVIRTSLDQLKLSRKKILENLSIIRQYYNESYKLLIREKIFSSSNICKYASGNLHKDVLLVVSKKITELIPDKPFKQVLIIELLNEEFTPESDTLRSNLLARLGEVSSQKDENEKKAEKLIVKKPTLNGLVNAALALCSGATQIKGAIVKMEENFVVLATPQGSPFARWLNKVFGKNTKKRLIFDIEYMDELSCRTKSENIDYDANVKKYLKIIPRLNPKKVKNDFATLESNEKKEEYLLDFTSTEIICLRSFMQQMSGVDKYVKKESKSLRKKDGIIRGILVELNAIKSLLIKAHQMKSEYIFAKDEYEQLKALEKGVDSETLNSEETTPTAE